MFCSTLREALNTRDVTEGEHKDDADEDNGQVDLPLHSVPSPLMRVPCSQDCPALVNIFGFSQNELSKSVLKSSFSI